jgi:hypothetical protein
MSHEDAATRQEQAELVAKEAAKRDAIARVYNPPVSGYERIAYDLVYSAVRREQMIAEEADRAQRSTLSSDLGKSVEVQEKQSKRIIRGEAEAKEVAEHDAAAGIYNPPPQGYERITYDYVYSEVRRRNLDSQPDAVTTSLINDNTPADHILSNDHSGKPEEVVYCHRCGTHNTADSRYCKSCATALVTSTNVPVQRTTTPGNITKPDSSNIGDSPKLKNSIPQHVVRPNPSDEHTNEANWGGCILSFILTVLVAGTVGAAGALILGLVIYYIIAIPASILTSGAASYGNGFTVVSTISIILTVIAYIVFFGIVWRFIYGKLSKSG